jgi:hypothetical protein
VFTLVAEKKKTRVTAAAAAAAAAATKIEAQRRDGRLVHLVDFFRQPAGEPSASRLSSSRRPTGKRSGSPARQWHLYEPHPTPPPPFSVSRASPKTTVIGCHVQRLRARARYAVCSIASGPLINMN